MKTLEHEIRDVLNRNKNKDIQIDIVELFQMVQEEYFNNFLTKETYEEYEHDLFVQCYFESLEDIFEQAVPKTPTPPLEIPKDFRNSTQRLKISQKVAQELAGKAANDNVKKSLTRKIVTAIAKRLATGTATGLAAGLFTGPGLPITTGIGTLAGLGLAAKDAYDIYKDVTRQPDTVPETKPAETDPTPPLPTKNPERRKTSPPLPTRKTVTPDETSVTTPTSKTGSGSDSASAPDSAPGSALASGLATGLVTAPGTRTRKNEKTNERRNRRNRRRRRRRRIFPFGSGDGFRPKTSERMHKSIVQTRGSEPEVKKLKLESREDIEATPRFTETEREKIDIVPRAENDLDTANRKRFRMENIKKKIIDESLNIINSRK